MGARGDSCVVGGDARLGRLGVCGAAAVRLQVALPKVESVRASLAFEPHVSTGLCCRRDDAPAHGEYQPLKIHTTPINAAATIARSLESRSQSAFRVRSLRSGVEGVVGFILGVGLGGARATPDSNFHKSEAFFPPSRRARLT